MLTDCQNIEPKKLIISINIRPCFVVFLQNKARREDFCPRNLKDMHMVVDKLMAHSHLKYKGLSRKLLSTSNISVQDSVQINVSIYFSIPENLIKVSRYMETRILDL